MIASVNKWWVVAGIGVIALVVAGKDVWPPKQKRLRAEEKQREVYVMSTLRINESETVKILSVPDSMLSDPVFDTRCLIYTNNELRQSEIKCLPRLSSHE